MKLPSKLHISNVEKLTQQLLELLESSQAVYIDISDVESTDTASVQSLCALQKSLSTTGSKINWVGSSKAFEEAAEILGVAGFLNLTPN